MERTIYALAATSSEEELRNYIAWDSAAGFSIVNNKRYMITQQPMKMQVNGISKTPVYTTSIGMTPFGKALLVEESPLSLISQTSVSDQGFEYSLDNDAYTLHSQHGITASVEFNRQYDRRLYTVHGETIAQMANAMRNDNMDQSDDSTIPTLAFPARVTPSNQARMEAAKLHATSGHMSDKYLIELLDRGLITGTVTDMDKLKAAIIYNSKECKCAACLLGKAVSNNPHTTRERETLPGRRICSDVVFSTTASGMKVIYHFSVDEASGFIDVHEMIFNNVGHLSHVHRKMKLQWALRGFEPISLQYDACKIIESMRTSIVDVGIDQDQPGQHQVTIESNVRKIRDHVRAVTASLHFIPDEIQSKYLLLWVIQTLNNSYNRAIDAIPMQVINPKWKLNAQVDMTVAYGDIIMAQVMKDQSSASKAKPAKHPCIVMGAKMNGSGTITVYSLLTQHYYQTSGLHSAIKTINWSDDLEKVTNYIIWNNIKVPHTSENDMLKPIPKELVMMPDYFNSIPETLLKERTLQMMKKMEKHANKTDVEFETAMDVLRQTAMPDIIAAIDQHKALMRGETFNLTPNGIPTANQTPQPMAAAVQTIAQQPIPPANQTLQPIAAGVQTQAQQPIPPANQTLQPIAAGVQTQAHQPITTANQTLPPIAAGVQDLAPPSTSPPMDHTSQPMTHDMLDQAQQPPQPASSTTETDTDTDLPVPPPVSILKSKAKPAKAAKRAIAKQVTIEQLPSQVTIEQPFSRNRRSVSNTMFDHKTHKWIDRTDNSIAMIAQGEQDREIATYNQFCALAALVTTNDKENEDKEAILQSRLKEMRVLIDKGTIHPIHHGDIRVMEMQKKLLTKIFTIMKRDGAYKSRVVTGAAGKPQDRADVPNSWAPTGKFESVLMGLRIALRESRHVSTIDFTAAFLNADLPKQITPDKTEFRRILEVKPEMIELILKVRPAWKEFICPGRGKHGTASLGSMFFVIDKALYGLIEASFAWHAELHNTLTETMGFEQSESDPCVYHSYKNGDRTSIIVYVDDLMVLAQSEERTKQIHASLSSHYQITTKDFNEKGEIDYLNVRIQQVKEGADTVAYELHQTEYCNKVIDDLQLRDEESPFETTTLPYTLDLFHVNEDSPLLNKADAKWYAMAVGKLLYTSSKVRTLLALPVSFLSKRMQSPTLEDKTKLLRVLFWLKQHPDGGLTIRDNPDEELKIQVWADASDNSHYDGKGHTGIFISIGDETGSPLYYASKVQSLVSRSSTEAELIAVYQSIPHALWAMEALTDWGYTQTQIVLYQDNISAIVASHDGNKPFSKLSHVNRRFFNAREYIHNGTIIMPHCDTRSMIADPLTKPMIPGLTAPHMRKMIGLDDIQNKVHTPNLDEKEVLEVLTAYYLNFTLDDEEDEV